MVGGGAIALAFVARDWMLSQAHLAETAPTTASVSSVPKAIKPRPRPAPSGKPAPKPAAAAAPNGVPAEDVVAFAHLPESPERARYEVLWGPKEGVLLRVLHEAGDAVEVARVEPAKVEVVRR